MATWIERCTTQKAQRSGSDWAYASIRPNEHLGLGSSGVPYVSEVQSDTHAEKLLPQEEDNVE